MRYYGSFVSFAGRGEMIANEDCYCEIDPHVVDQWHPGFALSLEIFRTRDSSGGAYAKTFAEIIDAMGGK